MYIVKVKIWAKNKENLSVYQAAPDCLNCCAITDKGDNSISFNENIKSLFKTAIKLKYLLHYIFFFN